MNIPEGLLGVLHFLLFSMGLVPSVMAEESRGRRQRIARKRMFVLEVVIVVVVCVVVVCWDGSSLFDLSVGSRGKRAAQKVVCLCD